MKTTYTSAKSGDRVNSLVSASKRFATRVIRKLRALRFVAPIHFEAAYYRFREMVEVALEASGRGTKVLCLCAATIVLMLLGGFSQWLVVPVIILVGLFMTRIADKWEQFVEMMGLLMCPEKVIDTPVLATASELAEKLGIDESKAEQLLHQLSFCSHIVLAEWDQENRICSFIGDIPCFSGQQVSVDVFVPRQRNRIMLWLDDAGLSVKKCFSCKRDWVNELTVLARLRGVAGVPRLLGFNVHECSIRQTFLTGSNVGSLMALAGVTLEQQRILSEQQDQHAALNRYLPDLNKVMNEEAKSRLESLLLNLHSRGVVLNDIKYGNVLMTSEQISLCDFDHSTLINVQGYRGYRRRMLDLDRLNFWFGAGRSVKSVQKQVDEMGTRNPSLTYAPVYVGKGVGVRRVGSVEFGTGKWRLMRASLPDLVSRRILDLGCNNGMLPLEMLRSGAASVNAYEYDSEVADYARLNKLLFERVDNTRYDFDVKVAPMREVLNQSVEGFDVATAFCSLYYEDVPTMAAICRHLSQSVPVFMVQANESAQEHSGELYDKASLNFLSRLLEKNGFSQQQIIRFGAGYDRPLIIARSDVCATHV